MGCGSTYLHGYKGEYPLFIREEGGGEEVRNKVLPCMKYCVLIYAGLNVFVVKLSFVVVFFFLFFRSQSTMYRYLKENL